MRAKSKPKPPSNAPLRVRFDIVQTGPDHPTIDISHDPTTPWVVVKKIGQRWIGPVSRHHNRQAARLGQIEAYAADINSRPVKRKPPHGNWKR